MDPDDFDPATLRAILEIQLEDLESLGRSSKGKGREGAPPADFDVALDTLRAELAASASVLVDSAMCRSMAIAVWRDRHALDEAEHDEDIARLDRELALRLFEEDGGEWMDVEEAMGSELGDNHNVGDLPGDLMNEQAIVRMPTPGNPDDDNTSTAGQPESSAWAQSRQPSTPPTPIKMAECVSCRVRYPTTDIARCPCSHRYCDLCLGELFQASMVDESLFPPRCCRQPIPVDDIRNFLAPKLVGQFLAKKLEYETPNRTYCHVPDCSAFVPPQFVQADIATCVKCTTQTCAICKAATHEGECPQDEEAQAVLRLAEEKAWQRCSACRRVVELLQGCNHITCLCGAEFCYECGARWKTCACEQWLEDHIIERGQAVANRDAAGAHLDADQWEQLLEEAMQNQRENHDCEVHEWVAHEGAHECDGCGCHMAAFIFECVRCRAMACRGCRYNRV